MPNNMKHEVVWVQVEGNRDSLFYDVSAKKELRTHTGTAKKATNNHNKFWTQEPTHVEVMRNMMETCY